MPYQVQPDRGAVFVDQNGFRMPTAVLLPLIAAVNRKADDDHKSPFEWSSMDFITDRNGLRKLLRWITAGATTVIKDFRIDTQLAGTGTVLFNRWEKRTQEEASGYTYGFNYEKASTKPAEGCSGSTGYHRIVQYVKVQSYLSRTRADSTNWKQDLNGLKMVVRFEVDACIPTSSARSKSLSVDDSLADAIAGLKLSTTSSADATKSSSKTPALAILKGGSDVPQASLVELTTRSEARQADYDWVDSYPQLFLSQTSHHFLAVHQRGRFSSVQKRTLNSTELRAIERNIQPALRKLRRLLDVIKALVIKHGERGRLSLVCTAGELKVYERTGQASCLPDECMELFNV